MEIKTIEDLDRKVSSIIAFLEKMQAGEIGERARLTSNEAICFIEKEGIPMSKSKFYKLTAQKKIPFLKAGDRLVFQRKELQAWCESQFLAAEPDACIVGTIVKSAQRRSNL